MKLLFFPKTLKHPCSGRVSSEYFKLFLKYVFRIFFIFIILSIITALFYYNFFKNNEITKESPLLTAVKENSLEKIKELLKKGVPVNQTDASGNGPLHITALRKNIRANIEAAVLLVNAGADIEHKNILGDTAVDTAQKQGNYYLAKYLLKASALKKLYGRTTEIDGYDFSQLDSEP
jgi:ankyrin repeat protein